MVAEPLKVRVTVEGLSDLEDALRALPDATAKAVLRRVGAQALQPVADLAADLAKVLTGRLRRSIKVGTKLSRNQARQNVKGGPNDVEVYAGAGALPEAHLEEFGSIHNRPAPFMRPAWDAQKMRVLDRVSGLLWAEILKSTLRIAAKAQRLAAKMGEK
jgi:HK97 gp10 family phage protein